MYLTDIAGNALPMENKQSLPITEWNPERMFLKVDMLEPTHYKNESIQSKIFPTLKLPRFFTTYTVREKARQF